MPHLAPRSHGPDPVYSIMRPVRSAGEVPPQRPTTEQNVAGTINIATRTISAVDSYLNAQDELAGMEREMNLGHAAGERQLAEAISSRDASDMLRTLRARITAAGSQEERNRLENAIRSLQATHDVAVEQESARRTKVVLAVGVSLAVLAAAGGGFWYWRKRSQGRKQP